MVADPTRKRWIPSLTRRVDVINFLLFGEVYISTLRGYIQEKRFRILDWDRRSADQHWRHAFEPAFWPTVSKQERVLTHGDIDPLHRVV